MAIILAFLDDENVFDPKDVVAMSIALDDVSEKSKSGARQYRESSLGREDPSRNNAARREAEENSAVMRE